MSHPFSGTSYREFQRSRKALTYLLSVGNADSYPTIEKTLHKFYESTSPDSPIYSFQDVKDIIREYLGVITESNRNGKRLLDRKGRKE